MNFEDNEALDISAEKLPRAGMSFGFVHEAKRDEEARQLLVQEQIQNRLGKKDEALEGVRKFLSTAYDKAGPEMAVFIFTEAPVESMPADVRDFVYDLSAQQNDFSTPVKAEFDHFFTSLLPNGDQLLVVDQARTSNSTGTDERMDYFVTKRGDEITGYSRMVVEKGINESGDPTIVTSVERTKTYEKFLRQGLGMSRLKAMATFSEQEYNQPLASDTLVSKEAKSLWNTLVESGEAEEFYEGTGKYQIKRYRMKSNTEHELLKAA